jgi:hypothetical protein
MKRQQERGPKDVIKQVFERLVRTHVTVAEEDRTNESKGKRGLSHSSRKPNLQGRGSAVSSVDERISNQRRRRRDRWLLHGQRDVRCSHVTI